MEQPGSLSHYMEERGSGELPTPHWTLHARDTNFCCVSWLRCCGIQCCALWEISLESGWCCNQCLLSNPTAAVEEDARVSSPWWGDIWAETWLMWGLESCTYQGGEGMGNRSMLLGTGNYQGVVTHSCDWGTVRNEGGQWGMKAGGTGLKWPETKSQWLLWQRVSHGSKPGFSDYKDPSDKDTHGELEWDYFKNNLLLYIWS